MGFFTLMGLVIAIGVAIMGITAFIGWITEDYDNTLRWVMTCVAYAITTALFIVNAM